MNIQIFSARMAAKELKSSPNKWHVVSIRGIRHTPTVHPLDFVEDSPKDMIIVRFDDISWSTDPSLGYSPPKREDVEKIFNWVDEKEPENLMVHCWAGISRSSAIAFLLSCKYEQDTKALLNPDRHKPNVIVMDYGLDILNNTVASKLYRDFILSQSP
jgi:predicted protein tyrosine phosphatase